MIIAIDPGLSGAIAGLTDAGMFVGVFDLPIIRDKSLAWIDGNCLRSRIFELQNELPNRRLPRFVVERVSAMPGQGVTGMFTFGCTFGSILGVLQTLQYPIEFVTPVTWKRAVGLSGKAKGPKEAKRAALDKARLLFPTADLGLQKHEGRAEALLLAHWAQRYQQIQKVA